MCAEERDDDCGVNENDGVGDDDEGRPLNLAAFQALLPLSTTSEVVAALEENAGDDRQGSRKAGERFGYGH